MVNHCEGILIEAINRHPFGINPGDQGGDIGQSFFGHSFDLLALGAQEYSDI